MGAFFLMSMSITGYADETDFCNFGPRYYGVMRYLKESVFCCADQLIKPPLYNPFFFSPTPLSFTNILVGS